MEAKVEVTKVRRLSDIDCSAYLISKGHKLLTNPSLEGKYVIFTFEKTLELEANILQFYNGPVSVDARVFAEAQRKLRILKREIEQDAFLNAKRGGIEK